MGALFIKQQQGAVTVTAREAAQCSVTKRQRKNIWKERKMPKKNIWKERKMPKKNIWKI